MTIRQRLGLSFLAILLLFGLNLVIYFWSNHRRTASVETLRTAVSRQLLVAAISEELGDLQQHVALLSQVMDETARTGLGPDEISEFNTQVDAIAKQVRDLRELSDPKSGDNVESLEKTYQELGIAWKSFYENFGRNHVKAITELVVRADPLSQRVLKELLPLLREDESRGVEVATANFYEVARLTDRMTVVIFLISSAVAVTVAYIMSRYLALAIRDLKLGTELIGAGDLDHRIELSGRDELGDLAQGFNEMTEHLKSARSQITQANLELEKRNQDVEKERQISESLLHNILPETVAAELEKKGSVEPKYFEDVTMIFTDFVGFTLSTERLAAEDLVHVLHDYFTTFDQIIARYGLEKLKTIGDAYMCVGGLPTRSPSHPVDAVLAAFEIVQAVKERGKRDAHVHWGVRVGIHTGPVIAGVVGIQKFAFDVWGDTVNYCSRMESCSEPNHINLSERTYNRVKDFFDCKHRGKVLTKEKKEVDMYFANGIWSKLLDDGADLPPPAFLRRYRVYFQKDPPSFPDFLAAGELEVSP